MLTSLGSSTIWPWNCPTTALLGLPKNCAVCYLQALKITFTVHGWCSYKGGSECALPVPQNVIPQTMYVPLDLWLIRLHNSHSNTWVIKFTLQWQWTITPSAMWYQVLRQKFTDVWSNMHLQTKTVQSNANTEHFSS